MISPAVASIRTITEADYQTARSVIERHWPRLHLAYYTHKTTKGGRLRFYNRPWLVAVYKDGSDRIVIKKSTKTGMSEWAMCDLFLNAQRGLSGMYVLPDRDVRNRFINTRFDALMRKVPEYARHMKLSTKDVDAKGLKNIYGQTWAFVGSGGKSTFYEFNADVMIYDEYDKCDPQALTYGEDRTLGAERDIYRKLGNPTISGYGIDEEFGNSNKQVWFIRCPHCGEWQTLDWLDNFVRDEGAGNFSLRDPDQVVPSPSPQSGGSDARACCRRCSRPMDRLSQGEWVAEFPDRDVSGYHVSRLFGFPGNDNATAPRLVIIETFAAWLKAQGNPYRLQRFWNNILGETYRGEGSKFDPDILARCAGNYLMPNSATGTIAGADVGGRIHLHVSTLRNGIRTKVFLGYASDWDDLHIKCHQYGIANGVIDAEPEHHACREFVRSHSGWYTCSYDISDKAPEELVVDHVARHVRTKRTASLDQSLQDYLIGRVALPSNYLVVDNGDFVKQMCAATRVQVENAKGEKRYVWDEGGKPDHHQHADNYERIAASVCSASNCISVG